MNANTQFIQDLVVFPAKPNAIPKMLYESAEIYQLEMERLFYGPHWHPVAHLGEIPKAGDYKTFFIGEVPILITRQENGEVGVFHNACTHRGTLLVPEVRGCATEFQCPYHRWLFDNGGNLRGVPGENDFPEDFCKADFGLRKIRFEVFAGLVFATLDDHAAPLSEQLGEIAAPLAASLGGDGRLKLLGYQKVMYNANWKTYRDQDGYHPPLLHAAFKMLNWQGGKGECTISENGNIALVSQLAAVRNTEFLKDPSLVEFKGVDPSQGSYVVCPSLLSFGSKHLDMFNFRFGIPRGPLKTEVHWAYFCHEDDDEEMIRHRLRQSSNMLGPSGLVSLEDAAVFHRIQNALKAGTPNAYFLKGVRKDADPYKSGQNDEIANIVWWEWYRRQMGFSRAAA
jgi:phenylpropionate dioxygenase-like ring-hydroxylating dioxygenase large terminal subunit